METVRMKMQEEKIFTDLGIENIGTEKILKDKQLCITNKKTKENQVFSPTVYQSCMNPKDIRIYDMTIQRLSTTTIQIVTRYQSAIIDVTKNNIAISSWKASIHKPDCRKCENCGRCSW